MIEVNSVIYKNLKLVKYILKSRELRLVEQEHNSVAFIARNHKAILRERGLITG
jgi:hypothetical protein